MSRKPIEITLGEKTFYVRMLTLGRVVRIVEELEKQQSPVAKALAVVGIALERDNPEEAAKIGDLEATMPEITTAMAAILRLAGFPDAQAVPLAEAA